MISDPDYDPWSRPFPDVNGSLRVLDGSCDHRGEFALDPRVSFVSHGDTPAQRRE